MNPENFAQAAGFAQIFLQERPFSRFLASALPKVNFLGVPLDRTDLGPEWLITYNVVLCGPLAFLLRSVRRRLQRLYPEYPSVGSEAGTADALGDDDFPEYRHIRAKGREDLK